MCSFLNPFGQEGEKLKFKPRTDSQMVGPAAETVVRSKSGRPYGERKGPACETRVL